VQAVGGRFFLQGVGIMEERESRENQWRLAGILITLNLFSQGERMVQIWHLWEHREQAKRTGNKRRFKAKIEGGDGHTPRA